MNWVLKKMLFVVCFFCMAAFANGMQDSTTDIRVAEMKAELDIRDSVMAAHENACKAESDSLRGAVAVEQAKSANWEQSYNTIIKDHSVCQQALRVSIDAQTEKKNNQEQQKDAAMMSGSAFLGGVAIGMLLFWLIFD